MAGIGGGWSQRRLESAVAGVGGGWSQRWLESAEAGVSGNWSQRWAEQNQFFNNIHQVINIPHVTKTIRP